MICLQGKGTCGKDMLLYASLNEQKIRRNMTVWISMNGGESWRYKKLIDDRYCAYSSLAHDKN